MDCAVLQVCSRYGNGRYPVHDVEGPDLVARCAAVKMCLCLLLQLDCSWGALALVVHVREVSEFRKTRRFLHSSLQPQQQQQRQLQFNVHSRPAKPGSFWQYSRDTFRTLPHQKKAFHHSPCSRFSSSSQRICISSQTPDAIMQYDLELPATLAST